MYSVYLRPWVLDRSQATSEVPHIVDLDQPIACPGGDAARGGEKPQKRRRSMGSKTGPLVGDYALAWRSYIRGHVVSKGAARRITQFMAACCGTTKERDDLDGGANDGDGKPQNAPDQKLALQRVHEI